MKTIISIIMATIISSGAISGQNGLAIGDKAPVFRATADNGTVWDLKQHLGQKYIVVYFYPAAMTSGCTKQACSYRDHQNDLKSAGIEVVGISGDNTDGLKLFRHAENLNFPLLSDPKGEIARAFGVPLGDGGSIKRTVDGSEHELVRSVTAKRWTFIIGKEGKIIYKNDSVNPEKDTEEVINFIKMQAAR
jgi:thioredoxin-dependent peroxiredoxin